MIDEQGGAELTCRFCDNVQRFTREELEALLDEYGGNYTEAEEQAIEADLDRIDPDHPAFTAHVDIQGDIPREKKEAIIARVSRCPVCKLLRSPADVIVS